MYELINSTAIIENGVEVFKNHMPVSWIISGIVLFILWEIVYLLIMKTDPKPRSRSWTAHCILNKLLALMFSIVILFYLPMVILRLIQYLIRILIGLGAIVLIIGFFKLNISIGKSVGIEKEPDDFPKAKFQDGEKVRVKKNLDDIEEYKNWRGHYDVGSRKMALEGKIVTITSHDYIDTFHVRELPRTYHLMDCCVEKIRKKSKKSKVKG